MKSSNVPVIENGCVHVIVDGYPKDYFTYSKMDDTTLFICDDREGFFLDTVEGTVCNNSHDVVGYCPSIVFHLAEKERL